MSGEVDMSPHIQDGARGHAADGGVACGSSAPSAGKTLAAPCTPATIEAAKGNIGNWQLTCSHKRRGERRNAFRREKRQTAGWLCGRRGVRLQQEAPSHRSPHLPAQAPAPANERPRFNGGRRFPKANEAAAGVGG